MIHKEKLNSDLEKFDEAYLRLRKSEDRIFNVEEIGRLPEVPKNHIHYHEWLKRKHSFEMFSEYIDKSQFNNMLDLACGNGWFINKLASKFNNITGVEVNAFELEQAEKVLQKHNNTSLHLGDIFELKINELYDVITVNAAIQYFDPFEKIVNRLLSLLTKDGELHILDTPFYQNHHASKLAKERSDKYYAQNDEPSLSAFYHHHNLLDLQKFNHEILYNPFSLTNKIKRKLKASSPFYWIRIKQH